MAQDWTLFFDTYAKSLHPTFKKQLSQQLLQKSSQTGIKQFQKYYFSLIVGMQPLNIQFTKNKATATIECITPTSWTLPTTISWTTKTGDLKNAHTKECTETNISFNWENDFPLEKVLAHISPYKKSKATKNGFGFDAHYYHMLIPDVELQFFFKTPLTASQISEINQTIQDFYTHWNQTKKGREMQAISPLTKTDKSYTVILDIGLKNNMRTITTLLKEIGEGHAELLQRVHVM